MKTIWKEDECEMNIGRILTMSLKEMWKACLERFGWRGMVVWFIVPIVCVLFPVISILLFALLFKGSVDVLWLIILLVLTIAFADLAFYCKKAYFKKRGIQIRSEP